MHATEEGQGIVALEAMAARKPVIATRVGGLPESILDGETGLLTPPDDPTAMAAAIAKLAAAPQLRSRMGAGGRDRVCILLSTASLFLLVFALIALFSSSAGRLPSWLRWGTLIAGVLALGAPFFFPAFAIPLWGIVIGVWLIFAGPPSRPSAV